MQIYPSHDPLLDVETEPSVHALVVAEDPLVCSGFVGRLAGAAVAEMRLDEDVREAVTRSHANVVLWDLGPIPDESTFELGALEVPVVALCPIDGDTAHLPAELLARGATGVLRRDASGAALRSALRSALCGLRVVDPDFVDAASGTGTEPPPRVGEPLEALTTRESEVLELMATGLSNKQIGDRLGISAHTAKFHIGAILAKLDAQSRTEAVVRAVQHGLVML